MTYYYFLCEFEYGYSGTFYQRNDETGHADFFDLDGKRLTLEGAYGYHVLESYVTPSWA